MNQCIQGDGGGLFVENNQPGSIQGCFIVKRYPYRKYMLIMVLEFILISLNDTYTNAYFDNVHFIHNSGNAYCRFKNLW